MDIDIPSWKKLADVQWGDHPLLLFEKDDSLLMLLAEKRSDRTIGFACAACKPFIVKGDASTLESIHFPTELTIVKKLNAGEAQSFLLAFTKPTYAQATDAGVVSAAEQHLKTLAILAADVKRLSTIVTLADPLPGENPLLSDASMLFSFLSFLRTAAKPQSAFKSIVGLDLKGDAVLCSVPSLSLGLVVSGSRQQRLHVLHLLAEEALQQNTDVLIFDTGSRFAGLSKANSVDESEYLSFSLPASAAGFSMKRIVPGVNAFVSLSSFAPSSLLAPFGLTTETDIGKPLEAWLANGATGSVDADASQFTRLKANRVAKLLSLSFQGVFSHTRSILEGGHSLGKVMHVDLSCCSPEAASFFCLGLLKELEKHDKPVFLVFEQDAVQVKSLVELAVNKFSGSNVSLLFHSEDEADLPALKSADFFVEVLGHDVAITQGGKPPQRVKLRPTYSACSEN